MSHPFIGFLLIIGFILGLRLLLALVTGEFKVGAATAEDFESIRRVSIPQKCAPPPPPPSATECTIENSEKAERIRREMAECKRRGFNAPPNNIYPPKPEPSKQPPAPRWPREEKGELEELRLFIARNPHAMPPIIPMRPRKPRFKSTVENTPFL